MQTLTIDIINEKAVKLLEDMELLQLIRLHHENPQNTESFNIAGKYKGAMQKQALAEIDNQLKDLR
ncbi:MAG: hypothetical protein WCI92_17215, partial [Bacteroidota bacterium]